MAAIKTKAEVVAILRRQLGSVKEQAVKALVTLYNRQTEDERNACVTKHHNNVGFTCVDSRFLTSLAQQFIERGFLTDAQLEALMNTVPKYAAQLVEHSIAQGKIRKEGGFWKW